MAPALRLLDSRSYYFSFRPLVWKLACCLSMVRHVVEGFGAGGYMR